MEPSDNPYDELEPLFNALPVLVRLVTREDILCILFHHTTETTDDSDPRMYMERPLSILMQENAATEKVESNSPRSKTIHSTVRTRFDRWMPFTTAVMFPIYPDHILSIAPLSEHYINFYITWADQLYADAEPIHREVSRNIALKDQTEEEIRRSYLDYLLHQFNPKGKPN